jgi:hypothetical protein
MFNLKIIRIMRRLRFLFVAALIVVFTAGLVSAQGKNTECTTMEGAFYVQCKNEVAFGTVEECLTGFANKYQYRIKGEWVGETSGSIYSFSIVQNVMMKNYVPGRAYNQSYVFTGSIECDGVPIAVAKIRAHITVNANGEVVVERIDYEGWTCL